MASVPHENERESFVEAEAPSTGHGRSTLSLLKNVILDLTQVVEDSTELIGASVREELAEFRVDMARHALSLVAVVVGAALATAGLAMLVSGWIGSWPITLLLFGGVYLAIAVFLQLALRKPEDDWK